MINCPFCNIDKTRLENTILDETQNFYVLPALGSLVEGYILIISKRHINSMSGLNDEEMVEYEKLINKYRKIFKDIYVRYPIVFEHGAPDIKNGNRVNSVSHAHTHIVNHNYKDEKKLLENLNFKKISKINEIRNVNKNYIFYVNQSNCIYVTKRFESIRQIMRIEIANDLNILYRYDWQKDKFENNIILTISKISNYLSYRNKDSK